MDPRCQFQYLDIQQCWPTSDCDFLRYAAQVTARGRQGDARGAAGEAAPATPSHASTRLLSWNDLRLLSWNDLRLPSYGALSSPNPRTEVEAEVAACPHGVLQVCLLTMEFFKSCKDDELRDVRDEIGWGKQGLPVFRCVNRPLLIEALADALLTYETERCRLPQDLQAELEEWQEALSSVARACLIYEILHDSRSLTNRPVTLARLSQAYEDLESAIAVLTPKDYERAMGIRALSYKNQLFIAMRDAFTKHGPFDRKYTQAAMDDSIAVIFGKLSIENGKNRQQIVDRLRKRFRDEAKRRIPE